MHTGKTSVLSPMAADWIFHNEHNAIHIKFPYQSYPDFCGLLLLAAFPKHTGEPYKQSGVQMEPWPAWGWLCVAVKLCGVG